MSAFIRARAGVGPGWDHLFGVCVVGEALGASGLLRNTFGVPSVRFESC